jgi:hypothetical protein
MSFEVRRPTRYQGPRYHAISCECLLKHTLQLPVYLITKHPLGFSGNRTRDGPPRGLQFHTCPPWRPRRVPSYSIGLQGPVAFHSRSEFATYSTITPSTSNISPHQARQYISGTIQSILHAVGASQISLRSERTALQDSMHVVTA